MLNTNFFIKPLLFQDELERELEELEQEELDNELLNVPAAAALPSVPTAEPIAKVPSRAVPTRPSRKNSYLQLTRDILIFFFIERSQSRGR